MKRFHPFAARLAVVLIALAFVALPALAAKYERRPMTWTGAQTIAHLRHVNGSTFTTADPNPSKAMLQAANFFLVDTTANAVDLDFADNAALDAEDIGSTWTFVVQGRSP